MTPQQSRATEEHGRSRFDELVDRRGTNSLKWDSAAVMLLPDEAAADPLPMWVADMDFKAPQPVIEALRDAAEFGVFGYAAGANAGYVESIVSWQRRRFGWDPDPRWVVLSAGVITSLKTIVQAFSAPGDSVLIQPPVYAHFHDDVLMNGRRLALAPLRREGDGYRFDAGAFERAIQQDTRIFILSNPHNPTGNVWSEEELRTMGEICRRRGVLVVSDEIHQDLVLNPALHHVPFASLSPELAATSITCTAPSKTFNLPGLQSAVLFIPDERMREQFVRQYNRNVFPYVNSLGVIAGEAAYRHGEPWLDELLPYLRANHERLAAALAPEERAEVLRADSLYLAWIDFRGMGMSAEELHRFMLLEARLWLDKGQKFGVDGHGYMRMNIGCPARTVDEAIDRLRSAMARHA